MFWSIWATGAVLHGRRRLGRNLRSAMSPKQRFPNADALTAVTRHPLIAG
jgi:hypothetical protein